MHFGNNFTGPLYEGFITGHRLHIGEYQGKRSQHHCRFGFHIHYYIRAVIKVLTVASWMQYDKYSYDREPITTEEKWQNMVEEVWQMSGTTRCSIEA